MSLPPHIAQAVEAARLLLPGEPGLCEGARFHSPTPLYVVETPLCSPAWGPEPPDAPRVMLCGTCRDNLSLLQSLLGYYDGALAWSARREFGNDIRRLGYQGWDAFAATRVAS